jgi:hypothetical protein
MDEISESEMYIDVNGKTLVVTKNMVDGRPLSSGTVIIG